MEDNKKNPYDDFFQSGSENDNKEEARREEPAAETQEQKPSYYYSYGPFKPASGDQGADQSQHSQQTQGYSSSEANRRYDTIPQGQVEMTPPRQVRAFAPTQSSKGGWQGREPRRTSFKAIFASFMVGVVGVGALMFTADKQNWFTGDNQPLANQPVISQGSNTVGKSGDGGNISTAADVVRPNNIAQIFGQSSPAVVKIQTFVTQQSRNRGNSLFDDPYWQFFGGGGDGQEDSGKSAGKLVPNGTGSGFFFESDGYILTNQHVIEGAEEIEVTVEGHDKPLKAKKLGASFDLDLAVLKVEGTGFPTLALGNSDNINIGDWVVAIGNPVGFDHTVTVGVLSAKERPISIPDQQGTRNYKHLLQTDASINPGNSGGPLLNLNGEVVGINTAVSSQAQGIGFAIPTSTILENLESLKANKEIPKPFIGATLGDITDQIKQGLGLSNNEGAYVNSVIYKSPAYLADLRQYDVIVGLDGTKYKTKEEIIAAIQGKAVGSKVTINIIRNGAAMDLILEVGNANEFQDQIRQQQQQQQQQPQQ